MRTAEFVVALILVLSSTEGFQWNGSDTWIAKEKDASVDLTFTFSLPEGERIRRNAWFKKNDSGSLVTLASEVPKVHTYMHKEYKGRVEVNATTGHFILKNVNLEDAGVYLSAPGVSNDKEKKDWEEEKYGTLLVRGTPTTPRVSSTPTFIKEGDEVELTCNGTSSTSRPPNDSATFLYTWFKDMEKMEGRDTARLSLGNVSRRDDGNYTCNAKENVAKGMESSHSESFNLRVAVVPRLVVKSLQPPQPPPEGNVSTLRVEKGRDLKLNCTVEQAYPDVKRFWWCKSNGSSSVLSSEQVLTLNNITEEEAGQYECQASNHNKLPNGTAHIKVEVSYLQGVKLTRERGQLTVLPGEEVSLTCSADSFPKVNMTLLHNGQAQDTVHNNSYNFNFTALNCGDVYKCTATNEDINRNITSATSVKVECRPHIIDGKTSNKIPAMVGEPLTLPFEIIGDPAPNITCLSHPIPQYSTQTSKLSTRVIFPNVTRAHWGRHMLQISNNHGKITYSFTVVRPKEPATDHLQEAAPGLGLWAGLGIVLMISVTVIIVVVLVFLGRRMYWGGARAAQQQPNAGRESWASEGGDSVGSDATSGDAIAADVRFLDVRDERRSLLQDDVIVQEEGLDFPPRSSCSALRPPAFLSRTLERLTTSSDLHTLPEAIQRPLPPPPLPSKEKAALYLPQRWGQSSTCRAAASLDPGTTKTPSSTSHYMDMTACSHLAHLKKRPETLDITRIRGDDNDDDDNYDDDDGDDSTDSKAYQSPTTCTELGLPRDPGYEADEEQSSSAATISSWGSAAEGGVETRPEEAGARGRHCAAPPAAPGSAGQCGDGRPIPSIYPALPALEQVMLSSQAALQDLSSARTAALSYRAETSGFRNPTDYANVSSSLESADVTHISEGLQTTSGTSAGKSRGPPPVPPKPRGGAHLSQTSLPVVEPPLTSRPEEELSQRPTPGQWWYKPFPPCPAPL